MAENLIDVEVGEQLARNERLVELFEEQGGDLTAPRPIDFFFYTRSEADGKALAADLERIGLIEVIVSPTESDDQWSVTGVKQASVREVIEQQFVTALVQAAATYLAEFDGWGMPV